MRTFSSGFQTEFGEWREFPLMIWAVEREDRRLKRVLADDNSIYLPSRIVDMRTLKPEDVEYLRGYESTE
jgi:hypothetical protein